MGKPIFEREKFFFQCVIATFLVCILVFSGCGNLSQNSDELRDSVSMTFTATPFGTKEFTLKYDKNSNFFRIDVIPFDSTETLSEDDYFVSNKDKAGTLDDTGIRKIRIKIDRNVRYLIKFYETKRQFEQDEPIDSTEYINTVVR